MSYIVPPLVSEREGSAHPYPGGGLDPVGAEDCVPDSFVMAYIASGATVGAVPIPPSNAEGERLRALAGFPATGPTSIERISAAATTRYGKGLLAIVHAWTDVAAALSPGHGAVIIGRPANLPAGHVMRVGVGDAFTDLHCVYVQRRTALARLNVFDPMTATGTFYFVTPADLATFYGTFGPAAMFRIAKA